MLLLIPLFPSRIPYVNHAFTFAFFISFFSSVFYLCLGNSSIIVSHNLWPHLPPFLILLKSGSNPIAPSLYTQTHPAHSVARID